jgi:hypothetical protein
VESEDVNLAPFRNAKKIAPSGDETLAESPPAFIEILEMSVRHLLGTYEYSTFER